MTISPRASAKSTRFSRRFRKVQHNHLSMRWAISRKLSQFSCGSGEGSGGSAGCNWSNSLRLPENSRRSMGVKWKRVTKFENASQNLERVYRRARTPTRAATRSSWALPEWSSRLASRRANARACCQGQSRPCGAESHIASRAALWAGADMVASCKQRRQKHKNRRTDGPLPP